MKPILSVCFLFLVLMSCDNHKNTDTSKVESERLYVADPDEIGMNIAIETAKRTLDKFDKALKSNQYDTSTFALKIKFPTETGNEHIWATSIIIKNGHYFGIVDNLPELTTEVKLGERIQIAKENITDWMYADNGRLRGAYTIKYIRSTKTKEEQAKFDSSFSFKIED